MTLGAWAVMAAAPPMPAASSDGSVLPFPPVPSGSVAAPTLQESSMTRRAEANHLPADAPNVLVIMMDDVGFGTTDTFGGEIHTPNLTKLRDRGISYNTFHTTALCSPTRAALLTGRNHHRASFGTIAERAVDWDGYLGLIPKTSATLAEVLRYYGYKTAAFGKWHNTPANQTTAMGPFDRWPTGHGFDYFYGFLAGETSQYEPRLYENTNPVEPPVDDTYHLTEDLADKAIQWMRRHRAYAPDKPFLLYWAPGAAHGPHHIFKEWADKYNKKFDEGWDAYRDRVFARQKQMGWIPANAQLTPRDGTMAAWESIPDSERPFQRRLMEIFAGFAQHADAQAGKVIDELDRLGIRDNTLVFYIWGDNGSSAEGQAGTISELLAQNQIPNTIQQQLEALDGLGGLDALGSPKTDNMYHAGWGWAGNTPFRHTKVAASHFGGTRNPMVISWPQQIRPDRTPRSQFHHVNDIAPTIYDILGIEPPAVVDGFPQDPIDGISMAYTFNNARAPGRKQRQYFEINGSRGIYADGWYACTFGPTVPWQTVNPGLDTWDASQDVWELYHITEDFTQMNNLADQEPERLEAMKQLFLEEAEQNKVFPIGGALWTRLHPSDRISTPYTRWTFDATTTRMPEFTAPGIGHASSRVTIDATLEDNASGVLYALGGSGGGLTVFMDQGQIQYEYNMELIERYIAQTARIPAGQHRIEVETTLQSPMPLSPAEVVIRVDGEEAARTTVGRTVPGAFTASETFDVGTDLGSPVSPHYADRRPFAFDGTIEQVNVELK
ncbi:arylsulfatase (plasmid) [Nodosilinea sp. E11]|nr:arylsulfatase [Nodosilinea sp. E11]WOD37268.1 arylsulfatase [Nodosilinea sp. E11]